ncbi:MAG: hypothetical protein LBC41_14585 [Clostridiales bacterium]|nr:hypothetical protein [Clostridiales bacterium]
MKNEQFKTLIEAIPVRHSVRTFLPDAVDGGAVEQMKGFIDSLELPFQHETESVFFEATPGKGLYNNGVNPASNIAFMSQTDLVSISKTGFVGELAMLYAVSLGLGTCWFGHYKLSELGKYVDGISTKERIKESALGYGYGNHVDVGKRVICCMPYGRADASSKRIIDAIMKKMGANRKQVRDLLETPNAALPDDIEEILRLASLAPSAGNSQVWRFRYESDSKVLTVAKPIGYRHFKWEHSDVDTGICAAHIWLGLRSKGYEPQVEVKQDADRAFWTFRL